MVPHCKSPVREYFQKVCYVGPDRLAKQLWNPAEGEAVKLKVEIAAQILMTFHLDSKSHEWLSPESEPVYWDLQPAKSMEGLDP
ncbi:hypothetical protein AXG93_1544s1020 [Marchantia polymorpha subsp. ruderalis]|uniref:Uncharacterized protein n=1 Tax=Marchantia polymorpha subsp. ruderalis TaxID=1480154 RepID=A0A176VQ87_MARPO|nr:hypothetical protein AXG93_1544s1020 [Marchantia polymorpha subsp. ruderalis]